MRLLFIALTLLVQVQVAFAGMILESIYPYSLEQQDVHTVYGDSTVPMYVNLRSSDNIKAENAAIKIVFPTGFKPSANENWQVDKVGENYVAQSNWVLDANFAQTFDLLYVQSLGSGSYGKKYIFVEATGKGWKCEKQIVFHYEEQGNYAYDVAAKFANLSGGTPVRAELYMEPYNWRWEENDVENLIVTLTDLTIDDQGALWVRHSLDAETGVPYEAMGHRWRIVLTWIDSTGAERSSELTGSIEPPVGYYNNLSGTLRLENGVYVYDYVFYTFIGGNTNPGGVEFRYAESDRWTIESANATIDGNLAKVTGRMTTDRWAMPNIDTYWVWTAEQNGHLIYSGCESSHGSQPSVGSLTATPGDTGYTDVTDRFSFRDSAHFPLWGASVRVMVTLADGTAVTQSPGETDGTGQVVVNWDDGGSISVTVHQDAVQFGQACTAELIVDWFWEDSGDRAISTTSINRCTQVYTEGFGG